jgi:hypothetical protein
MITAHDAADYILSAKGEMTSLKLHTLLYYCQAWSLVMTLHPYIFSRHGLSFEERGNRVITYASMLEYYSSIPENSFT